MLKKYQLKNGMTVLLVESHKAPVVSVQMWVRTGSADEPKGLEGISHFIEHLVFKGTKKFEVGEIASRVEGDGGELNAYTSFDRTVYHVTISKHFEDTALEVISEMMGFPQFDPREIDNERGVVIEEIKQGEDSLSRRASRALFETVYPNHPYGKPVIGYEKIIGSVTPDEIKSYFEQRYVPENMTLVVTGDFDYKEMKGKVKKLFGCFEAKKLKKYKRNKESKQERARTKVYQGDFQETLLHIAWRIPKADHKDIPALDVLSMIMGHGESSRLMRSLRIENPIANYSVASTYTPRDPGFLVVSSSLNYENIDAVLNEIQQQIQLVLKTPPSFDELNRVKNIIENGEHYSLETVDGMASSFGGYEDLFREPKYMKKFLKDMQALTPEDILKAARKYLKPESLNMVMLTSKDKKEGQKKLQKWARGFKKERLISKSHRVVLQKYATRRPSLKKIIKKMDSEKMERRVLKSGATLIVRPNYDTAVVSVKAAFLGGIRIEDAEKPGVNELLSRVWSEGTKNHSEADLNLLTENMSTSLNSFAGRNTAGMSMTCLAPSLGQSMELFFDSICCPLFSEETIEREKLYILESIKTREDSPAQLAILDFMRNMFGTHPYGKDPFGSASEVKALKRQDVLDHWSKMVSSKNMSFVMVGNFDIDEWSNKIDQFASQIKSGSKVVQKLVDMDHATEIKNYKKLDKKQSHIVYGFRGVTFDDPDRLELEVIQSILSGQGGRLFIELRDKESLAYSVAPIKMDGIDPGYFGAYIGCSPEKGKKAIGMIGKEFDKLMHEVISAEELDRAKRNIIGTHDISLQKNSSQSSTILFDEIYGLPYDNGFKYAESFQKVTAQSIQKVAQRIFSQKKVISVVGADNPF